MTNHQLALDSFVKRIKPDPNIVAMLLYGSLSYGTVWHRSDIDLELIIRDGTAAPLDWRTLEEEGVEINITGFSPLSEFKKYLQKVRSGYDHGLFGRGTLVFSKDDGLTEMFEDARKIGEDDAPRAFSARTGELLSWLHKAEKHATVLDKPLYAQRFLQLAAPVAADMELIRHRENPTRESILRAMELHPQLMDALFVIPSTTAMTTADVQRSLQTADDYLMQHQPWWSRHVLRYLSDGEPHPASHIWRHCGGVPLTYLAEKGIIGRTTEPLQLFKKSKLTVDEPAFFSLEEGN